MPLSTNQYGFVIDPFFSFCDQGGKTIANGYVRVFRAGTSTPVLTYRNFDGAFNAETIELDNSGRTMTQVIASKGNLYKVCVYDANHSQEAPILTVDKVAVIGASVNATNLVQGMNDVAGRGWIKSLVADDTANVSLDPTGVSDHVETFAQFESHDQYKVPLVKDDGSQAEAKLGHLMLNTLQAMSILDSVNTASGTDYVVLLVGDNPKKISVEALAHAIAARNGLMVFEGSINPLNPPDGDELWQALDDGFEVVLHLTTTGDTSYSLFHVLHEEVVNGRVMKFGLASASNVLTIVTYSIDDSDPEPEWTVTVQNRSLAYIEELAPAWTSEDYENYKKGSLVSNRGHIYRCKTNTPSSTWVASEWELTTIADEIPNNPPLFVQPTIFSGNYMPNSGGSPSLHLENINNQHTLVLIGLKPSGCYHVNDGDTYEVVFDGLPIFGTANFSMGLFKMVGHPTYSSSGPVTFRRLTTSLAPRPLTGARNDGGISPYGFSPVASNPIRFTLNEDADFDNGELIYLGIAVAYDSNVPNDYPVLVGGFPQVPVYDYNHPMNVVQPVYYGHGQTDKIDADGFIAREFTIGYSDADFTYTSGFSSSTNILEISSGGISEITGKTYPCGIKLIKYDANRDTVVIGGRRYRTVTINGVTWLAENLDYKFDDLVVGQGGSYSEPRANYYNNDEATYGVNGNKYGLLYNWLAVKYLEDHKAELIPGWHVPTTSEWEALATAVGGYSVAGTKLKSTTGWDSGAGTDDFRFSAFPAGYQSSNSFYGLGTGAYFYTANEHSSANAYAYYFNTSASMNSYNYPKSDGYPLRLVKD